MDRTAIATQPLRIDLRIETEDGRAGDARARRLAAALGLATVDDTTATPPVQDGAAKTSNGHRHA